MEKCTGLAHEQGLKMDTDAGRQIFWRRMAPKLKSLENDEKLKELKELRGKASKTKALVGKLKKKTQQLANGRKTQFGHVSAE